MNLMKLFNKNYLFQTLKKSKVVLSIFIFLIPILNTIILIMNANNNSNLILKFNTASVINFIGIYFLPVIISICLFNYIYKKRSVDFVNSMPISRKSIFITNTIAGIIIFASMLIVNVILILILNLILSNVYIPYMMLIDYLWYWFIVYIFVFSATNLAMTISGNAITQIVLTLLLVFLIPYLSAYFTLSNEIDYSYQARCTDESCVPTTYYCGTDTECNINKISGIYNIDYNKITEIKDNNYTAPFGFIYSLIMGNDVLINAVSVIKMIVLTVIYTIVGYILFIKRKMEVSETSFKNIHIHNIVRALTLIPIVSIAYLICKNADVISIIFVLVLILIYYFIYDLITKKGITNIKLSLIYFVGTICILTMIFSINDIRKKEEINLLDYKDIKEIAVDPSTYMSKYYQTDLDMLFINNKEIKEIVTKNLLEYEEKENSVHFKGIIKLKNNKEYKVSMYIPKEDYNKILDIISEDKKYIKQYKDFDINKIYAVQVGNNIYSKKDGTNIINLVKDTINKLTLKEYLELQRKYSSASDTFNISIYTYENHTTKEKVISPYVSYELLNMSANSNNKYFKDNVSYILPSYYSVEAIDSYPSDNYYSDYLLVSSAQEELYNFALKESSNEVDMQKDFIVLKIDIEGDYYIFTTNNITGYKEILDKKKEELKSLDEYKYYFEEGDTTNDY